MQIQELVFFSVYGVALCFYYAKSRHTLDNFTSPQLRPVISSLKTLFTIELVLVILSIVFGIMTVTTAWQSMICQIVLRQSIYEYVNFARNVGIVISILVLHRQAFKPQKSTENSAREKLISAISEESEVSEIDETMRMTLDLDDDNLSQVSDESDAFLPVSTFSQLV